MELPEKKSGISKDWNDQKFLMIGSAGIGKSDFWQHSKNPLYVEAEPGLNFIDAYKLQCRSWNDVGSAMQLLIDAAKDSATFPYDLIIIDTADRLVDYATQETIAYGQRKWAGKDIQTVSDFPGRGGGWAMREAKIKKVLKALEDLPCAAAVIGHLENKQIDEDGQSSYHKSTISIGGKVGCDILSWSDHTLQVKGIMQGDQLKRTVYTKPTKSRECKSRGGVIKDGWVWTENSKENFDKLREQFT